MMLPTVMECVSQPLLSGFHLFSVHLTVGMNVMEYNYPLYRTLSKTLKQVPYSLIG